MATLFDSTHPLPPTSPDFLPQWHALCWSNLKDFSTIQLKHTTTYVFPPSTTPSSLSPASYSTPTCYTSFISDLSPWQPPSPILSPASSPSLPSIAQLDPSDFHHPWHFPSRWMLSSPFPPYTDGPLLTYLPPGWGWWWAGSTCPSPPPPPSWRHTCTRWKVVGSRSTGTAGSCQC